MKTEDQRKTQAQGVRIPQISPAEVKLISAVQVPEIQVLKRRWLCLQWMMTL